MKKLRTLIGSLALVALVALTALTSCERHPALHLHRGPHIDINLPIIDLELDVYWDYANDYSPEHYDWRAEWLYGWDETDVMAFGPLDYAEPTVFNVRRYYTGNNPDAPHTQPYAHQIKGNMLRAEYDFGFWDILAWNEIETLDGVQSLIFDEESTYEYVTASTNQTMHYTRYSSPKYSRSFYQPEILFAGYAEDEEIDSLLTGFELRTIEDGKQVWYKKLDVQLLPCTYIYLTQVILHHNRGKITGVDGSANLSGMARSVVLNNGVSGSDAITVNYNVRFKRDLDYYGGTEKVDIAGGRLLTFGMCNFNPNRFESRSEPATKINEIDQQRHYIDIDMQFNNGMDSTFVFDVTDQVRRRYKGGVLTIELDMDTIPVPRRSGGSAFDAVVKDFEDGGTHEFSM
ncbi:MAG: hypothetical protein KBS99_02335 [Prevotellaceae bacterium]|nr:hypothetical protein [Candidatus Colivivens caballi]